MWKAERISSGNGGKKEEIFKKRFIISSLRFRKRRHARIVRFIRNEKQRQDAKEEQSRASLNKMESQVCHARCPQSPQLLTFHPYESHLAVALKDCFGYLNIFSPSRDDRSVCDEARATRMRKNLPIKVREHFCPRVWNYQSGTKLTYCASRGNNTKSCVTALEFINSHDLSLLMVGSDDGSVRIWKNYCGTKGPDPILLTAWQALADVQPTTKTSSSTYRDERVERVACGRSWYHRKSSLMHFSATAGLVTKWEQKSLTLAVTGDVRIVRLWDAETELKKQDIPTGTDCCTTCIDVDGTGWSIRRRDNDWIRTGSMVSARACMRNKRRLDVNKIFLRRCDDGTGLWRWFGPTLRSKITSRGSASYDLEGAQCLDIGRIPEEGIRVAIVHRILLGRHKDLRPEKKFVRKLSSNNSRYHGTDGARASQCFRLVSAFLD